MMSMGVPGCVARVTAAARSDDRAVTPPLPGAGLMPYRCQCAADLPVSIAAALHELPDTAATALSAKTRQRAQIRRSYNRACDLLSEKLDFPAADWQHVGPSQYEDRITKALVDALATAHEQKAAALCLQQVLLGRQQPAVREFYRHRPMGAFLTPAGQLWPDFVLNGIAYEPPEHVPSCFFGEVKYNAKLNVPLAEDYRKAKPDIDIEVKKLWNPGHYDRQGMRVPHLLEDGCNGIWHTSRRKDGYIHSAVQLDIYLTYPRTVLDNLDSKRPGCGFAELATHPELRVSGLFVDAWSRYVDDRTAYTNQLWTTATFAGLLTSAVTHYWQLSQSAPSSLHAKALGLLAARLLHL
jgi:hypothetical protein